MLVVLQGVCLTAERSGQLGVGVLEVDNMLIQDGIVGSKIVS